MKRLSRSQLHPSQIVVLSYAAVILLGTVLLSLPMATSTGQPLRLVDAFFMATSAACVTGLVVVDPGLNLSLFGQGVILVCIQIGGLGLMVFTTVFLILSSRRLAIGDRLALEEAFTQRVSGSLRTLLLYIVAATFVIEGVGAALLTLRWWGTGQFATFGQTLYYAVFHSVSAFCNAGFALFPDNFIRFQNDPYVQITISLLIIMGGIGFLVGLDVKQWLQQSWYHSRWERGVRSPKASPARPRLSLHSKLVLLTTAALLGIGTVSYFLLERQGAFMNLSFGYAWLNAFFASVTARTAGFNTVDYAQMSGAALLCTMVLMFIGGSPGSTAGGVKTSTFALLVVYSMSRMRGHNRVHAFGRSLPEQSRDRAGSVVVAAVALLVLACSALIAVETRGMIAGDSQALFLPVLFETISAFGTVGLSVGHTPQLTDAGRFIVAFVMLMGRAGPITIALAVSQREKRQAFRYAEENIMVG